MTPEQRFLTAALFTAIYMGIGAFATRELARQYGVRELPPFIRLCGIIGWPIRGAYARGDEVGRQKAQALD